MPLMALTSLRLPGPTFWPKADRFVTTFRNVMALNLASGRAEEREGARGAGEWGKGGKKVMALNLAS